MAFRPTNDLTNLLVTFNLMAECSNCRQMKSENKAIRKSIMDTNKEYVAVVNENLALRRYIENLTGTSNPIVDHE